MKRHKNRLILFILCLLAGLIPVQVFAWSYSKENVMEFLINWKDQVLHDAYLPEHERDLRMLLLNRFAFQVDRKYSGENLQQFLMDTSWDMALTDEMRSNRIYGSDAELLKNLNQALKENLEPSENILSFLRSFIEYSTVKAPRDLEGFVFIRAYTNDAQVLPANPQELSEVSLPNDERSEPEFQPLPANDVLNLNLEKRLKEFYLEPYSPPPTADDENFEASEL